MGVDVAGDGPRKIDVKRIGVTLEGMYLFLEEIGFVEWRLPELWPSVLAQRRGIPQREGLARLTSNAEINFHEQHKFWASTQNLLRASHPNDHIVDPNDHIVDFQDRKLQHRLSDIVKCRECFGNIAVGEHAYVEHTTVHFRDGRGGGLHETCLRLKEEHSKRCEYPDSTGWRYVETYERGAKLP